VQIGQGIVAGREENVVIRNGACEVTLLPCFGGKISSIRINRHELLQQPLVPVLPRTKTMTFDAGDASGWDECLPSVAACTVHTAAGPKDIPDHGDLWRTEWQMQATGIGDKGLGGGADAVTLVGECFSLPLVLERTLKLSETATGWRLDLDYKLTNSGSTAVPWSWAAHPLFSAAAGDRLVLPDSIHVLRLEGSGGGRLGTGGDAVGWPVANLASGGRTDLSVAQSPETGIGDKLFAGPLAAHENWCALERPSAGVRIRVSFDAAASPYLGLWICYGGWPDRPGPKQVCVAMEPATAPVDSLAIDGEWSRVLGPGQSTGWPMRVDFERI
jgi:galactose mutarotase-like enzyme